MLPFIIGEWWREARAPSPTMNTLLNYILHNIFIYPHFFVLIRHNYSLVFFITVQFIVQWSLRCRRKPLSLMLEDVFMNGYQNCLNLSSNRRVACSCTAFWAAWTLNKDVCTSFSAGDYKFMLNNKLAWTINNTLLRAQPPTHTTHQLPIFVSSEEHGISPFQRAWMFSEPNRYSFQTKRVFWCSDVIYINEWMWNMDILSMFVLGRFSNVFNMYLIYEQNKNNKSKWMNFSAKKNAFHFINFNIWFVEFLSEIGDTMAAVYIDRLLLSCPQHKPKF